MIDVVFESVMHAVVYCCSLVERCFVDSYVVQSIPSQCRGSVFLSVTGCCSPVFTRLSTSYDYYTYIITKHRFNFSVLTHCFSYCILNGVLTVATDWCASCYQPFVPRDAVP